jgi:hypothetical protein
MLDQYFCREDQGPQNVFTRFVYNLLCECTVTLFKHTYLSFFQAKRLKRRCNLCEFCKVPECRVSSLRWLTRVLYSFSTNRSDYGANNCFGTVLVSMRIRLRLRLCRNTKSKIFTFISLSINTIFYLIN